MNHLGVLSTIPDIVILLDTVSGNTVQYKHSRSLMRKYSISHTIQTLWVTQQHIHTLHERLGRKGGYYALTIQIIISPYTHLHTHAKHYSLAYVFNNLAKLKFVWTQRCQKNTFMSTLLWPSKVVNSRSVEIVRVGTGQLTLQPCKVCRWLHLQHPRKLQCCVIFK